MEHNNVMAGDYVLYKGEIVIIELIDRPNQKVSVRNRHVAATVGFDKVDPLPLKRIHLTKNGFEAEDETDNVFSFKDGYKIGVYFCGDDPEASLSIDFADKNLWMPVFYVHELQDAMKLLGVDKIMVL